MTFQQQKIIHAAVKLYRLWWQVSRRKAERRSKSYILKRKQNWWRLQMQQPKSQSWSRRSMIWDTRLEWQWKYATTKSRIYKEQYSTSELMSRMGSNRDHPLPSKHCMNIRITTSSPIIEEGNQNQEFKTTQQSTHNSTIHHDCGLLEVFLQSNRQEDHGWSSFSLQVRPWNLHHCICRNPKIS